MQLWALCTSVDFSLRGGYMECLIGHSSNHSTPSDSSNFAPVSAVIPADSLYFSFYKVRRICSWWWEKSSKVNVIFILNRDSLLLGKNWKALKYLNSKENRMQTLQRLVSIDHVVAEWIDLQLHVSLGPTTSFHIKEMTLKARGYKTSPCWNYIPFFMVCLQYFLPYCVVPTNESMNAYAVST